MYVHVFDKGHISHIHTTLHAAQHALYIRKNACMYSNNIHRYTCTKHTYSAHQYRVYTRLASTSFKHQIVQQVVHYLEELESSQEVIDVAPQRLQRRIGLLLPHAGNLTCQHAVSNLLQLRGHHNKTLHQHNMESGTHWSAVHQTVTG